MKSPHVLTVVTALWLLLAGQAAAQQAYTANCERARLYYNDNQPSKVFNKSFRGVIRGSTANDSCGRDYLVAYTLKPRWLTAQGAVSFDVESRTFYIWPTQGTNCSVATFAAPEKGTATITSRLTENLDLCSVGISLELVIPSRSYTLSVSPLSDGNQFATTNTTTNLAGVFYSATAAPERIAAAAAPATPAAPAGSASASPPATSRPPAGTSAYSFITPGATFKDCQYDCPAMIGVRGTTYAFGDSRRNIFMNRTFAASRYEVTFAEWDACVADGGCTHRPSDDGLGRGSRPVVDVSYADIQVYLTWLSKKTGKTYRLLSEAEWEFIAREGKDLARPVIPQGVYGGERSSRPVGQYRANALGFHDLFGNVWEITADCWSNLPGSVVPTDGKPYVATLCGDGVLRGGAYGTARDAMGISLRQLGPRMSRYRNVGFRVARD